MHKFECDNRFVAMKHGLNQLKTEQIFKILNHVNSNEDTCVDDFNYDEDKKSWCPLAIGLGVPEIVVDRGITNLTNEIAKPLIEEVGRSQLGKFSLNPLKGIKGDYFRENRIADLVEMCNLIISERKSDA